MESKTNKDEQLLLPEPTLENPYAQIDFLFNRMGQITPSIRGSMMDCASFYKKVYLAATNNHNEELVHKKLFYIAEEWDSFSLLKLQNFFNTYNVEGNPSRITSGSVAAHVTSFRKVLNYAASHKLISGKFIHRVACAPVRAETTQNAAYSDKEMDSINNWLQARLLKINKLFSGSGYVSTGLGKDPRTIRTKTSDSARQIARKNQSSWDSIDDLRWYFENVMDCMASCKPVHYSQRHYWFYRRASKYRGGYYQLLKDWQIKPVIDLEIIMPLALKLSLETGLNPSSLWNLTVDCFQEKHPLTGVPYLQYYKARSSGHMEMHINPYDKDLVIREFKEGQASVIRKTIAFIREVTAPLRMGESGVYSKLLFLFQKTGKSGSVEDQELTWETRHVDDGVSSGWCKVRALEDGLKADDGKKLQLTVGRFRSTKITDMVRRGIDFFEIQSHFGHKSILTTLKYISRNNIEFKAYSEIMKVLEVIHDNRAWEEKTKPSYVGCKEGTSSSVVYKGIHANCRNVFDPPEDIKNAKDYQPGHACTRYNMCLFCKNVVLMRYHLPMLVVYQRQIRQSVEYNIGELPNSHYYQRTLGILDYILDPDKSEFSREDLEWAASAAECIDDFIDPVVYGAVM